MASKTERIKAWVSNNVVVTKAVFFILGLVVSQSIVEYMVVCKLMLFLEEKIGPILIVSSIIINAFDGVSSLFPFLLAYIAHASTNSFNVTVFTTGAYAMGLILLWVTAEFDEHSMFYVALVLIALGKSGRGSTLQSFLQDQLMMKKMKDHNHNHNHTRETPISEQHQNAGITITDEPHTDQVLLHLHLHLPTKIWWHSAWICGYVISLCALGNATHHHSWSKHLEISALLVATAHLVFYSGFFCYAYIYNQDPPRRPFGIADFRELKPDTYKEILLWAAFIGYSLVLATGNTLFIAQTSSTKFVGSKGIINPVSLFFVLKSFICDIVVFLFWCVVEAKKKVVGTTNTITMVRIGGGMICGVLCCVIAREVEIQRLDLIRKEGILSPNDTSSAMGVLWLTPQYCLLGLMEGLAGGGFVTHNQTRLSERSFISEAFSELVLCVGKFGSILVMLIFRGMFGRHINNSQMDGYFLMLAIFNSAFFCLYLLWALLNHGDSKGSQTLPASVPVGNNQGIQLQELHDHDQIEEENRKTQNLVRRAVLRWRNTSSRRRRRRDVEGDNLV